MEASGSSNILRPVGCDPSYSSSGRIRTRRICGEGQLPSRCSPKSSVFVAMGKIGEIHERLWFTIMNRNVKVDPEANWRRWQNKGQVIRWMVRTKGQTSRFCLNCPMIVIRGERQEQNEKKSLYKGRDEIKRTKKICRLFFYLLGNKIVPVAVKALMILTKSHNRELGIQM